MEFNFFDEKDNRNVINNIFSLLFFTTDFPFKSSIIPTGFPSIVYVFGENQKVFYKKREIEFKELIVGGQFDRTYDYLVTSEGSKNIGANLHPTGLYKILGTDISLLTNNFVDFTKINKELSKKFLPIFIKNHNDIPLFIKEFKNFINNLDLTLDKNIDQIDIAVNYILKKEGMIQVVDLLKIVSLSQKSLEVKFKKIVGLTPGKYIRLTRFIKLMRKYESKEIDINDLIYMYNYYDHSHFIKDFKLFMSQSTKSYFKKDFPLIKAYSKDL